MTNEKKQIPQTRIIWLSIDFEYVKKRIEAINKKIQETILKYESQEVFKSEKEEKH
jgi:tetrahydromethanopterin S-methyltransferase subunit G